MLRFGTLPHRTYHPHLSSLLAAGAHRCSGHLKIARSHTPSGSWAWRGVSERRAANFSFSFSLNGRGGEPLASCVGFAQHRLYLLLRGPLYVVGVRVRRQ